MSNRSTDRAMFSADGDVNIFNGIFTTNQSIKSCYGTSLPSSDPDQISEDLGLGLQLLNSHMSGAAIHTSDAVSSQDMCME